MRANKTAFIFVTAITAGILLFSAKFFAIAEETNGRFEIFDSETAGFTREELLSQIEERNRQLAELDKDLSSAKQNLQETQQQRQTLQREINILTNSIRQLDLNIKSDQIMVERLGLEIESLNYDLRDIETSIKDRKRAITKTLLELQRNDYLSGNLLAVFLRGANLADSFLEIQSLKTLQSRLALDITNLINLHEKYNLKISESAQKRQEALASQRNFEHRKLIASEQERNRQNLLSQTRNQESVFQQQLSELEKLQRQIAEEVESFEAILRTQIDPSLLPRPGRGVLGMPLSLTRDEAVVTQSYGGTSFAQSAYRGQWHNGVDFRASIGTTILSAEDGTVINVGDQDKFCYKGAYGKFVVIKHGNELTTMYAHLSRYIVSVGDKVKRGETIGYSGNTGYATGPHLHFTVFASQTLTPAKPGFPEGTMASRVCGPMPTGGDLNPLGYL